MVGLPTNTNMYLPLADSPSIRKVSLVNFSNEGYELSLNGPAFIMLDMSDLGMSYDIESIGSGIVSRKLRRKTSHSRLPLTINQIQLVLQLVGLQYMMV